MRVAMAMSNGDLQNELFNHDKILSDYFFFAIGVDGIVYNEEEACDPNIMCKCVKITREDGSQHVACWKKGVIGMIGEDELDGYCPEGNRIFPESAQGFERRLQAFEEASAVCNAAGANTLEERLACMSAELRHRKEALAQVG